MGALFQIIALCAAADVTPAYTVHIREQTAPEQVIRVRLTGSTAVMDAVEALRWPVPGLRRMDMWIVRTSAGGRRQVLRIDWTAISQKGESATNYQILEGDRLFLQARPPK